ncbi:anaerobic C4-dicarboxylate transporter family protein [Shigella flexneri]
MYAIINSPTLGLVQKPLMNTTNAILIIMLSVATLITVFCKVETDNILTQVPLKQVSVPVCVSGCWWLGDTFRFK